MAMTTSPAAVLIPLLLGVVAASAVADHPDDYLVRKDRTVTLKETLTMIEEQGGIAGKTVTTWTVQPSGEWTRVKEVPRRKGQATPAEKESGKLTQEQLIDLAGEMAAQGWSKLPARVGEPAKVNPHRYVLIFGDRRTALEGVPARRRAESIPENIRKAAATAQPAERSLLHGFAKMAEVVEKFCRGEDKKEEPAKRRDP
jgi:hypothetical protein